MGLKDEILGCDDRATRLVKIPEWKQSVTIRAFSGAERDDWEQNYNAAKAAGKPLPNIRAKLAALIIVDEKGDRVFSDDDAIALGKKSAKALDRIFAAFLSLNKLTAADEAELEKNS